MPEKLIKEFSKATADGQSGFLRGLTAANDLCLNVEAAGYVDYILGVFGLHINFHTVPHVKDLIHFGPWCAGGFLNHTEERRNLKRSEEHTSELQSRPH